MSIMGRVLGQTGLLVTELGLGCAALGNLFKPVTDGGARATLDAAYNHGIRYFDTAPFYGFGLSERRMGDALRERRGDMVISSKVGRLLRPELHIADTMRHGFASPMPFEPEFDYSYDAILRSHEASLHRTGLARIDILYVHDIGRMTHGDRHDLHWHQLTAGGGFRALERLRDDEHAISAYGLGVNETTICLEALAVTRLDVILLAGRYTLLDQRALDDLLPACARAGTALVIGGPYNSGILATGTRGPAVPYHDYAPAAAEVIERVRRIERIAEAHDVPLPAAALQFPLAHPVVASVIPGLGGAERVAETARLYRHPIPPQFWTDLRDAGLTRPDAPVPPTT